MCLTDIHKAGKNIYDTLQWIFTGMLWHDKQEPKLSYANAMF